MIRHVVMWKFKEQAEGKTKGENCRYVKERLEALPGMLPFIRRLEVGINEYPSQMAADMILITEFESKEDLDLYAVHPDHVKVSEYVTKVRESRVVCDYTL
jgi:Stress responsive A/B Barrel Domain.